MIKDRILVSDTNIFLDLMSVDLLAEFFSLPSEIYTTDLVMSEISRPLESEEVNKYVCSGQLNVKTFGSEELKDVLGLFGNSTNNTSIPDCSVWYLAKKIGGILLTGDAKLRKSAEKDSVRVAGILFIFDSLVSSGVIDRVIGADKLSILLQVNPRLPKPECEKRIQNWRKRQ